MHSTADLIRERAATVVNTVAHDPLGGYGWVKGAIELTIQNYRGRFLHEVIQNGYDQHEPGSTGGRLAVHFIEDEGDHGVLYVGNGGAPLSHSNFLGIAALANSDKEVGRAVGNKGVGFKSVYQICDVPEVYSAIDQDDPGFGGFSFRFGREGDLDDYIGPHDDLRAKVEEELHLALLTVPLTHTPKAASALREQGMVTVLRLPAATEQAADEIRERIDDLLDDSSPVLLFLDRLEWLSVKSGPGSQEPVVLTREVTNVGGQARVLLNGTDSYLWFERTVPQERLHQALVESVETNALDKKWLNWKDPAIVSIATSEHGTIKHPAAYTFLPMGAESTSPLGGHINAPFITDYARRGIDTGHPVNRLFHEELAKLASESASALAQARRYTNAVVDILGWDADRRSWLQDELAASGRTIEDALLVPARKRAEWVPISQCAAWPDVETDVITAQRIATHTSANLIDSSRVDPDRMNRLDRLGSNIWWLEPDEELLADWVEELAAVLHKRGAKLTSWASFYDDLKPLFADADNLRGRKILLTDSGDLAETAAPAQAAEGTKRRRRQRAVFFSPRANSDEDDEAIEAGVDISPPASLRRQIVFMHRDLVWRKSGKVTAGRSFLFDGNLVGQYRATSLLQHLGNILSDKPTDPMRRDALAFAFRVFGAEPAKHAKALAGVGLHVPTANGAWIRATQAFFSSGWGVAAGDDLSALHVQAPGPESELARLGEVLLASPDTIGADTGELQQWTEFLRHLGVGVSIPIVSASDPRRISGSWINANWITGSQAPSQVPPGVVDQWRAGIGVVPVHHPQTIYGTRDRVYWFLGQHEVAELPENLRTAYARLVFTALPALKDEHRRSEWTRARGGGEMQVPTPLWAFLTTLSWVPNSVPRRREREFRVASESWFATSEDMMAASYFTLIDPQLRKVMGDGSHPCWSRVGFRNWSALKDAVSLVGALSDTFAEGGVPDPALGHFRGSLAAAWAAVADPSVADFPWVTPHLLVDINGRLELLATGDGGEHHLFVASVGDATTNARLARELGWPVVHVDTTDPARLDVVAESIGDQLDQVVRTAHEWSAEVIVDDSPWAASEHDRRLVDEVPWLPLLLAASMTHSRSGIRIGRELSNILRRVASIRIVHCSSIAIASTAGEDEIPPRLRGVLPLDGSVPALLTTSPADGLTWQQLEVLSLGVLELVGRQQYAADVALSLRNLEAQGAASMDRPSTWELAHALEVSEAEIADLEAEVFGAATGIVSRLRLIAPARWGALGVQHFDVDEASSYSYEDILAILIALEGGKKRGLSTMAAATESSSPDDMRRRLGISLAEFNAGLAAHLPEEPLLNYGAAHPDEFNFGVRRRHEELLDWARSARYPAFASHSIQADWPSVRKLEFLAPLVQWACTYDELPDSVINDAIDTQMTAVFGQRNDSHALQSQVEVRSANGRALIPRLERAQALIVLCCDRSGSEVPDAWRGADAATNVRLLLDNAGALDFTVLDDGELAEWLQILGAWPDAMERSLEPSIHGLTVAELDSRGTTAANERQERLRASRQVSYQGSEISVDGGTRELVERVDAFLDLNPKSLTTSYRHATLSEMADRSKTRGSTSAAGKDADAKTPKLGRALPRLSNDQTHAIGVVGEMIAYKWLQVADPEVVDVACWKSTNVTEVHPGVLGDDSLGYDFEVPRRRGTVMYEVKATSGGAGMIELGETEVRTAQEHARNDRWRLLIVEYALSEDPRVHMLPNPFGREGRGQFRFDGNSIRMRFRLS